MLRLNGNMKLVKALRSQEEFNRLAVPLAFPEPVEIADHVPSAYEVEKMRKAEEKRLRKNQKKLHN